MTDPIYDKLTKVQDKYANDLMNKANVVAVGIGLKQENGQYTETPALVVMVSKKVPLNTLSASDRIPSKLEGVDVDVVETGPFFAN
jgi:hypothetical protein